MLFYVSIIPRLCTLVKCFLKKCTENQKKLKPCKYLSCILVDKERVAKKFSEKNKFFSHLQEITSKNTGHKKFTITQILKMINCYDEFNNELGEVMSSAFDCVLVYPVIKTEVGEDVDIEALAIRESNVTAASTMIKIISKIDTSIERLHDLWTIDDDTYIKYKVILQEIFRDSRCVPDEFYPSELICTNPDLNAMKAFLYILDFFNLFLCCQRFFYVVAISSFLFS